jgi:hypothetical protein
MSFLKKPAKCVQYVHKFEEICLLAYTFYVSTSPGVVLFCRSVHRHTYVHLHLLTAHLYCSYFIPPQKKKFLLQCWLIPNNRKKSPQKMLDDPCRLRQVIIVRIWLDFYEDDMLPWVLASIHIQRSQRIKT